MLREQCRVSGGDFDLVSWDPRYVTFRVAEERGGITKLQGANADVATL
jgi:hypothetical protein